ncbi:hypothetical protein BVX94_03995 [bacterium B17]|nr:hypothetical protein BVX94_03995 [bacterium B17]
MKRYLLILAVVVFADTVFAGTIPGAMSRETLKYSSNLSAWSVGLQLEGIIDREVDYKNMNGGTELTAAAGSVFLGYDFAPWITAFVTLGASAVEVDDAGDDSDWSDPAEKWSLGLNANIWHYEIIEPDSLKGRLTFKAVGEIARYDSEDDMFDAHWVDVSLALPLCYEVMVDYGLHESDGIYSSVIYVGPGFSFLNGRANTATEQTDFEETQTIGVVGGMDIYFARNLSFGVYGQYFKGGTVGSSLQYHF